MGIQMILVVELWFTFMLVMNLFMPVRRIVVAILRFSFKSQTARLVVWIIAVLLLFAFANCYYTQNRLGRQLAEQDGYVGDAAKEFGVRVRIFREQRNMYLSGLAFFHGIFLWRLVKLYDRADEELADAEDHKPQTMFSAGDTDIGNAEQAEGKKRYLILFSLRTTVVSSALDGICFFNFM